MQAEESVVNNVSIEEYNALKERYEDLKAEYQKFARVISHDLAAPFRQIEGFASLITGSSEKADLSDKTLERLGFISSASIKAKDMLSSLLEFSRLGNDLQKNFELIDCDEICKNISKKLHNDYHDKVKFRFKGLPALRGNKNQLFKLFFIVMDNAAKFKKTGCIAEIEITASKLGKDSFEFSVKDNGIGIDKKYWEKIFEIFRTAGTSSDYPGEGVGLAFAKKIVNNHNGKIWLEDSNESGSAFKFTIHGSNI